MKPYKLLEIRTNLTVFFSHLTRAYTKINLGGGNLPPGATRRGGENLNCKFKTLASWISGISIRYFKGSHTVHLSCKYYFIPPSNKTSRNTCF